jgi:hypothetical protein
MGRPGVSSSPWKPVLVLCVGVALGWWARGEADLWPLEQ